MTELRERFVYSASALFRVLYFVGLELTRTKIWSGICFLLIFQAGLYIAIERSIPHFNGFFQNMDHMIPVVDRFARFFSTCVVFFLMILKLDKIIHSFCHLLEPVDHQLQRPDLSWVRYTSIAGVTWIVLLVSSN